MEPFERAIAWRKGPDPEYIWEAEVDGARWSVRLGDFPAEPLYTLLVEGREVASFDDWPPAWRRG